VRAWARQNHALTRALQTATLLRVSLQSIFEEAASRHVFPGGVVFCARGENITAHEAFGTTAYDDALSRPVATETIYDLASVSKMWTLTAFLIAKREANVKENAPLSHFWPEFDRDDKREITLRHLMMHSAGFHLHIQRIVGTPGETWLRQIAEAPLEAAPGVKVNYTCTAYFLLARMIETISGTPLHEFIEEALLKPLQLPRTTTQPLSRFSRRDIAPTEMKGDGTPWHGVVHDEAARQWFEETGGFCGNAGLFSTAHDLARFCRTWLNDGEGILHSDDVKNAFSDTQLENAEGDVYRGWGWQLHNATFMTKDAPNGTAGHMGFTGPTFFLNPHTLDVVIVLNNRVHPTRNGPARFVYHRRIAAWHFETVLRVETGKK
jgi:serine-type D-Ala-D-Ala carboxypeptidase